MLLHLCLKNYSNEHLPNIVLVLTFSHFTNVSFVNSFLEKQKNNKHPCTLVIIHCLNDVCLEINVFEMKMK